MDEKVADQLPVALHHLHCVCWTTPLFVAFVCSCQVFRLAVPTVFSITTLVPGVMLVLTAAAHMHSSLKSEVFVQESRKKPASASDGTSGKVRLCVSYFKRRLSVVRIVETEPWVSD